MTTTSIQADVQALNRMTGQKFHEVAAMGEGACELSKEALRQHMPHNAQAIGEAWLKLQAASALIAEAHNILRRLNP